jgi:hypothetical protein
MQLIYSMVLNWVVLIVSMAMLLLDPARATAQVTVGETTFPLGLSAFPSDSQCLGPGDCIDDLMLLDWSLHFVAPRQALLGLRLDVVAIDIEEQDLFRLTFSRPIRNQLGEDLYLGQACFLASPLGDGVHDVEVRAVQDGVPGAWARVAAGEFHMDLLLPAQTVYYADPEIKSNAYVLWLARIDLERLGVAPGDSSAQIELRGTQDVGSGKLDAKLVGNLNEPPQRKRQQR